MNQDPSPAVSTELETPVNVGEAERAFFRLPAFVIETEASK